MKFTSHKPVINFLLVNFFFFLLNKDEILNFECLFFIIFLMPNQVKLNEIAAILRSFSS